MTKEIDNDLDALESLEAAVDNEKYAKADEMADALEATLNDWHSRSETFDTQLDKQIHKWYMNAPSFENKDPFFSPSATSADPREIYERLIGSPRDGAGQPAYQGRWTRIGTSIGDIIQRDILFIEKHVKDTPFKFERTEHGTPMFEEFAKKALPVKYRGHLFYLQGSPDGVMTYVSPTTGEITRVGLEIKSKQTTYARTGHFSMRKPDASHVEQCKTYSMMYNLDYYVILYVNGSRKSWFMSEEEVGKYPDMRAFGLYITREEKMAVLDKFADILDAVRDRVPPLTDLSKFTFNNYKRAIAKAMTDEEWALLEAQVEAVKESGMKANEIAQYIYALDTLKSLKQSEEEINHG